MQVAIAMVLTALPFTTFLPTAEAAISEESLTTFADGSTTEAFNLTGHCPTATLNITLPFDARVYGGLFSINDSRQAVGANGTIAVDIGSDGSVDQSNPFSSVYPEGGGTANLTFSGFPITVYAASHATTGEVTIPITVTPCINIDAWNFSVGVHMSYIRGGPEFSVDVPNFQILLGSSDPRWSGSINLTHHFAGTFNPAGKPPLPYLWHWSVERDDGGTPSASAVLIDNARDTTRVLEPRNDSMEYFEVTSTGTWTGSLVFRVRVTDYWNRSAVSNNITLCVIAQAGDACQAPSNQPQGPAAAAPVRISVGGQPASVVEAGVATSFDVSLSGPLSPNATVEWYVDGAHAGSGTRLRDFVFQRGDHDVEARLVDGSEVRSIHSSVYARSPGALGAVPFLTGFDETQRIAIVLGFTMVGVFFARPSRGRFLVSTVLLGAILPRARREALLDHFVRGRLYQVIVENPGIHFSELRRRTGAGNGSALYHLGVLEKAGFVHVVVESSKTRFYPTDQSFDRASYGLTPLDHAVVDAVERRPGIQQKEISRDLGQSPTSISRTVKRLVGFGFLTATRNGRDVALFPRAAAPASVAAADEP